jgi:hypothetical protein
MSDFKKIRTYRWKKYFEPTRKTDDWFPGASIILYRKGLECEAMKSPKRNGVSQRKTDDSFCREEGEKYWQKWPPINSG